MGPDLAHHYAECFARIVWIRPCNRVRILCNTFFMWVRERETKKHAKNYKNYTEKILPNKTGIHTKCLHHFLHISVVIIEPQVHEQRTLSGVRPDCRVHWPWAIWTASDSCAARQAIAAGYITLVVQTCLSHTIQFPLDMRICANMMAYMLRWWRDMWAPTPAFKPPQQKSSPKQLIQHNNAHRVYNETKKNC